MSNNNKDPKILKTTLVAESELFKIESLDLVFSNGATRCYERLHGRHKKAVMVVPILNGDTLLLVKEYAVGMERYEINFPMGGVEPGETEIEAANRELMEEVGFGSNNIKHLKTMSTAPGYSNGQISVLLAKDLYPASLSGDEPEELEVITCKLDQMHSFVTREDFSEAKSIAAMLIVKNIYDNM